MLTPASSRARDDRAIGRMGQDLVAVRRRGGPQRAGDDAAEVGAGFLDRPMAASIGDGAELDAALGQRSGLVEADDVNAAQRLHGTTIAYEDVVPCEPFAGTQLRGRGDEWQPLRYRGDRQRDRGADRIREAAACDSAEEQCRRCRGRYG